jgi:hypothetical protein
MEENSGDFDFEVTVEPADAYRSCLRNGKDRLQSGTGDKSVGSRISPFSVPMDRVLSAKVKLKTDSKRASFYTLSVGGRRNRECENHLMILPLVKSTVLNKCRILSSSHGSNDNQYAVFKRGEDMRFFLMSRNEKPPCSCAFKLEVYAINENSSVRKEVFLQLIGTKAEEKRIFSGFLFGNRFISLRKRRGDSPYMKEVGPRAQGSLI